MSPSPELVLPRLRNFIGGEFADPELSDTPLINPSDQSLLGYQARTSALALEAALDCATRCHESRVWYSMGEKRAEVLRDMALRLESQVEQLAQIESATTGVVITQTRFLIGLIPAIFRGAAQALLRHPDCVVSGSGRGTEVWHKPWGPALCITPWNSPAPLAAHKIASALAAGAPVIIKPSECTPFSTQLLIDTIAAVDLPAGTLQLVHGAREEGSHLVGDKRIKSISFTGGEEGGQAIAAASAKLCRPLQLELGGHNPFIILPDADREATFRCLRAGLTTLNGQWCRAVGQIFVPETMLEDIIGGFDEFNSSLAMGPAVNEASAMGPLVHAGHKVRIVKKIEQLESLGAKRCLSLPRLGREDGCFQAPQILRGLSLSDDTGEIFGPVATIHSFSRVDELVRQINRSGLALSAYLCGSDMDFMYKVVRGLDVGSAKINGVTLTSLSPEAPRAAWGQSGLGDEGTFETFRFFQGASVLGVVSQAPRNPGFEDRPSPFRGS